MGVRVFISITWYKGQNKLEHTLSKFLMKIDTSYMRKRPCSRKSSMPGRPTSSSWGRFLSCEPAAGYAAVDYSSSAALRGSKLEKLAKNYMRKFVKLTGPNNAFYSLTSFWICKRKWCKFGEINLEKFVKSQWVNLFLASFSHLESLCRAAAAAIAAFILATALSVSSWRSGLSSFLLWYERESVNLDYLWSEPKIDELKLMPTRIWLFRFFDFGDSGVKNGGQRLRLLWEARVFNASR